MKQWSLDCQRKQNDINAAPETLKFLDLLAVGVGSSVGVGISVLIGGLIKDVAGPAVVVSIALAGLAALVAGLCFAEFGVRFLKVNSPYAYSYIWSSENFAFLFGWALILQYVAGTASAAKAIITFVDALAEYRITEFLKNLVSTNYQHVFPHLDIFSLGIVAAVTVLYAFGKRDSIIVKKVFTVCNVISIATIIIIGGLKADVKNWDIEEIPVQEAKDGLVPYGVVGIVKGAAIGLYGFIGFDGTGVSTSEIKRRKRNLPLAILATVFFTFLAYEGVAAVLILLLPYYRLNPQAAVPFAFQEIGWTAFKWITAVATFFGFQTSLFGSMYSFPRIIQSMANDGLLFHCLGNGHSVTKIPLPAAITGGLIAAAAAGIFPFQLLVNLAVLGALFVYTALAISVILFRYSPKLEGDEKLSESCMNLINNEPDVSVKAVVQNYFNFKEKQPTNLTKIIITGNIVVFGLSSVGISVVFTYFYDSLIGCDLWAVIPVGVLLCAMFFNLISMTCQPKDRESVPFRVPLIPFVPCLSIFLNIFLMLTFDSLAWISFVIWMVLGLTPHFAWRFLKHLRGETGENSLYEINRTNALKLNQSIWKIKKDKKSFYEGTINRAFSDDFGKDFNANSESEVKKHSEKTAMQLLQAEVIQTAEVMAEESVEPLEDTSELNFVHVNTKVIDNDAREDEKVQWECVAEIHTEEELPHESVALEIVDNTYNFLMEVSEELLKNEDKYKETDSAKESETAEKNSKRDSPALSEKGSERKVPELGDETKPDLPEGEPFGKIKHEINKKQNNEENQFTNEYSSVRNNSKKTVLEDTFGETIKESSEKNSKNSVDALRKAQLHATGVETSGEKQAESILDEQNKIKNFKEKLNLLLKSQISGDSHSERNSVEIKPSDDTGEGEKGEKKDDLKSSIKTLSKSQIKGKLEILLSKGPPKRSLLGDSFNIKIKENESEKANEGASENHSNEVLNGDENFAVSSSTLQENIKRKLLSLKRATSNRTTDVSV